MDGQTVVIWEKVEGEELCAKMTLKLEKFKFVCFFHIAESGGGRGESCPRNIFNNYMSFNEKEHFITQQRT